MHRNSGKRGWMLYHFAIPDDDDDMDSPQRMVWRSSAFTDPGRKRALNEDALFENAELGVWAVADGMGGHKAGDVASQTIVDSLRRFRATDSLAARIDSLESLILEANADLLHHVDRPSSKDIMGSTVALLTVFPPLAILMWAGDSRIYRLHRDRLERLTEDHTMVHELVKRGHLSEEEAETHPSANIVLRAVGGDANLKLDLEQVEIASGDRFLLCSDGLYKDVSEKRIESLMRIPDIHECNHRLRQAALDGGGSDNITCILVDFHRHDEAAGA